MDRCHHELQVSALRQSKASARHQLPLTENPHKLKNRPVDMWTTTRQPLNLTALLATVIDCATRKIVGWAMGDNYKTPLIISAVEMAARNPDLPDGAVFNSDRGSNYTSGNFAAALRRLGIRQSVGRTGICYDNALSESVNASLKVELVHRTVYPTLRHARKDIA